MKHKAAVDYAGTIEVERGDAPKQLYKHQKDAIKELNKQITKIGRRPFAGLLVIPTGGGKTLTAARWLLQNYVDNQKKVLWIAHRHELLEQAQRAFRYNAYSNLLKKRKSFNYRVISGIHDKPKSIQLSDDVIIASKDSLNAKSASNYLLNWLNHGNGEVFLVIDEAHHAIAKTYRKLIDLLKPHAGAFRMLGLTATPFRTAQNEQGLLKKLFVDDIVYGIDLRTLILRGILSEPVFEELETNVDMTEVFNENDFKRIQSFDIDAIGKETAKTIAKHRRRNNFIVSRYVENRDKYGKTLVFALNRDNALALNALFRKNGVASDYVISAIYDAVTGVKTSPKDNKEKIAKFRKGELDVLINVNILTEGADLPKVQSVFLTRPTISTVLMTQMIGRGLRGEKAGGLQKVYIVSFIDNWKDKIAWVNPETLFLEENTDFNDITPETKRNLIRLISIAKIEEFARLMDQSVDTTDLENLDFIQRIPVGLYAFSILLKSGENQEEREKHCEALVYDNIRQAYADFIRDLPDFFRLFGVADREILSEEELEQFSRRVEDEYFYGCEKLPGYRREDIKDILQYYAQYEVKPKFIKFENRSDFDVSKIAAEIYKRNLGAAAQRDYLNDIWQNNKEAWQAFFGYGNRRYFINEVNLAIQKLLYPDDFSKTASVPRDIKELKEFKHLSLSELREKAPEYWRQLSNAVFEKAKDADGYYTSAGNGFKSKQKIYFQIDHIKPFSKGGLTTLDNLQLLTRQENLKKGNKIIPSSLSSAQFPTPPSNRLLLSISRQEDIQIIRRGNCPVGVSNIGIRAQKDTTLFVTQPTDVILFFTTSGKVYSRNATDISSNQGQIPLSQIIALSRREKVTATVAVSDFKGDLIMLTRSGQIKRISLSEFERVRSGGIIALSPEISPDLRWVKRIYSGQDLIIVSRKGQALRFAGDSFRSVGRAAGGVAAMKLRFADEIAGVDVISSTAACLLVVTEQGFAKRVSLSGYPIQARNGIGVRTLSGDLRKTGNIIAAYAVPAQVDLVALSRNGDLYCRPIASVIQQARATQGKRIETLDRNDSLVTVAIWDG